MILVTTMELSHIEKVASMSDGLSYIKDATENALCILFCNCVLESGREVIKCPNIFAC
jgi:hypothetical protein